jgi:hypothetical protein
MANNGHDPSRLDRREGLVEVLLDRFLEFEEKHKRLPSLKLFSPTRSIG